MKKPVLIAQDAPASVTPATAPPVPDDTEGGPAQGRAMIRAGALATHRGSALGRFFWASTAALVSLLASVAAWRFVAGLFSASPALGWVAAALVAAFVLALLLLALREVSAYLRLARIDRLARDAATASAKGDLEGARAVTERLARLYLGRADMAWGLRRMDERRPEVMDAETLLELAEIELLTPLDAAARREIEAAARQVAAVTALVPLALADVAAALFTNVRMMRRIAEIYGGRAGTFGSWRLLRRVMAHLVATGVLAVGDDMVQSLAGGGLLAKLSRRFGEGVVNGALTARVGLAAMEVCRPMPFRALSRPRVSALIGRSLTGLFSGGGTETS